MSCRTCGAPCDDTGACTHGQTHRDCLYQHLGAGTDLLADTQERVRAFLALSDKFPDDEPMWMCEGIRVNWGDLRVLAAYETARTDESNHRT